MFRRCTLRHHVRRQHRAGCRDIGDQLRADQIKELGPASVLGTVWQPAQAGAGRPVATTDEEQSDPPASWLNLIFRHLARRQWSVRWIHRRRPRALMANQFHFERPRHSKSQLGFIAALITAARAAIQPTPNKKATARYPLS